MKLDNKKRTVFILFFSLLPVIFCPTTVSANTLLLEKGKGSHPLGFYLEYLEDADKKWTIDDVSSGELSKAFIPSNKDVPPFGFELREAVSGQEALEIWEKWKPSLIWMDIRMPVMDGYEAAKIIRDWELGIKNGESRTGKAVIIGVSASVYEEERAVAISEGCDDFLRKPFRDADIFDMMSRHLGIRFVYEQVRAESAIRSEDPKNAITPKAIAALPDDLLAEFRKAAEIADFETAIHLAERIHPENEALADALLDLVENFRFDTLEELFRKGE